MDFSAQFVSCLARSGEAVCQAPNGIGSFQLFAESAFGYYPQTLWLESSSFTPFLGDSTWRQLVRIYRKQEGSLDGTNGYGNRQRGYYQNCIQNLAIFGHEPTHCKLEYGHCISWQTRKLKQKNPFTKAITSENGNRRALRSLWDGIDEEKVGTRCAGFFNDIVVVATAIFLTRWPVHSFILQCSYSRLPQKARFYFQADRSS